MRTPIAILTLAAVGVTASPATAQVERYELGQRLKRFEAEWETADAAGRSRALETIRPLTRQYLTFQYGEAARTLDDARFALRATPPTDAERWFAALAVVPEKRLVDAESKDVVVEVRSFYKVPGSLPATAVAYLQFDVLGCMVKVPLDKLPARIVVPFGVPGWVGDQPLYFITAADGLQLVPHRAVCLSTVSDLSYRAKVWARIIDQVQSTKPFSSARSEIEFHTARTMSASLLWLARGEVPEDDITVRRWGSEVYCNTTFAGHGVHFYTARMSGLYPQLRGQPWGNFRVRDRDQYWMTVPTTGGKLTPCRLFIPPEIEPKKPTPVVVALHGMGGSENLFFEGYGAGCVRKACEKRGWLLVCPRSASGFLGGPPPVTDILDKLAERYPIDKSRVFLMGHSMGAAQTVELAQAKPGAFAAVAALGGGGRVRKPEAFAGLPAFVGVGTEDFARGGATGLAKALADAGVKTVTLKEYPGVEHTLVVRYAVDDVFAAFDKAAAKP